MDGVERAKTLQEEVAELGLAEAKMRLWNASERAYRSDGYELLYALGEMTELTKHLQQLVGLQVLGLAVTP